MTAWVIRHCSLNFSWVHRYNTTVVSKVSTSVTPTVFQSNHLCVLCAGGPGSSEFNPRVLDYLQILQVDFGLADWTVDPS
jgi:hypothetical protein